MFYYTQKLRNDEKLKVVEFFLCAKWKEIRYFTPVGLFSTFSE